MAKGFAIAAFAVLVLASCSPSNSDTDAGIQQPQVVSFPISNSTFKNCNFQTVAPTYALNSPITPNPIDCQEGVATSVQLLSTAPLPTGLSFSMASLSLVGTPTQKVSNAPYDFYIENEAGYLILHLTLTVQ